MTASAIGYERMREWVKARLGRTHATVISTVTWATLCVLMAQRVTAAAVARALPAEHAGSGRARLMRVRRWWMGPAIEQAEVSPQLIVSALALLAPGQAVVVALDTTRVGKWEVWLAGIVVAGRTVPIGWAGIPYPWPKGRFRSIKSPNSYKLGQAADAALRRGTLSAVTGVTSTVGSSSWRGRRKLRICWCANSLKHFLPQRSLTRSKTAKTSFVTLPSSHKWGMTLVRRRSSSNARSARLEVRTYC